MLAEQKTPKKQAIPPPDSKMVYEVYLSGDLLIVGLELVQRVICVRLWQTVHSPGWKSSTVYSASGFALRMCPTHCVKILSVVRDLFHFFPRRILCAQVLSQMVKIQGTAV